MTKAEFNSLKPGDVVRNNKTKSIYALVSNYSTEPITQIAKDLLVNRYADFDVVCKTIENNESN